jgi:Spy/CpxP family protein refolding chaperone
MEARQFGWVLAALLAASPAGAATPPAIDVCDGPGLAHGQRDDDRRQGPRGFQKWWMDEQPRAELGITAQQSAKIEDIFQAHIGPQRERYAESRKLEPVVEQLIKEGKADPAHVAQQVQRLEQLKAEMNAARIVMLYRQMRELTPAQREKLRQLQERREAERRKSTESQHRR